MKPQKTPLTLIELLVVIVIVVLLPAVITASLGTARNLAKIPICANNLRQIGVAVYDYAQVFDGNLPNVLSFYGDEEYHPYVAYRGDKPEHFVNLDRSGRMIPYRLACLYEIGLIDDANLFYCPAHNAPWRMLKSYNNPPPWGALPQDYNIRTFSNQWVRVGYDWFPVDPNAPWDPRTKGPTRTARAFDAIDPDIPYLTDAIWRKSDIPHNVHDTIGVNALYKSGCVVYCDDPNAFDWPRWWNDPPNPARDTILALYYMRLSFIATYCGCTE